MKKMSEKSHNASEWRKKELEKLNRSPEFWLTMQEHKIKSGAMSESERSTREEVEAAIAHQPKSA